MSTDILIQFLTGYCTSDFVRHNVDERVAAMGREFQFYGKAKFVSKHEQIRKVINA